MFNYEPYNIVKIPNSNINQAEIDQPISSDISDHLLLRLYNENNEIVQETNLTSEMVKILTPTFKLPVKTFSLNGTIHLDNLPLDKLKSYHCCLDNVLNHTSSCAYFRFKEWVPIMYNYRLTEPIDESKKFTLNNEITAKFAITMLIAGLFLFTFSLLILCFKCELKINRNQEPFIANLPNPNLFTIVVSDQHKFPSSKKSTSNEDLYGRYNLGTNISIDVDKHPDSDLSFDELPPTYVECTFNSSSTSGHKEDL